MKKQTPVMVDKDIYEKVLLMLRAAVKTLELAQIRINKPKKEEKKK